MFMFLLVPKRSSSPRVIYRVCRRLLIDAGRKEGRIQPAREDDKLETVAVSVRVQPIK